MFIPLLTTAAAFFLLNFRQPEKREWYLMLVNREHPLPSLYQPELTELTNGEMVDSRILPDLQEMFDEARSEGIDLFVRSGYRSSREQEELLESRITAYQEEGLSRAEAEKEAENWVALPGRSEHQTGLCVDINSEEDAEMNRTYEWLAENAWKYGFIERYPPEKSDITGVNPEPWHYRYVGNEAAAVIKQEGLCLEEYLWKYK